MYICVDKQRDLHIGARLKLLVILQLQLLVIQLNNLSHFLVYHNSSIKARTYNLHALFFLLHKFSD